MPFEIDAATQMPRLPELLAQREGELGPHVQRCCAELRALPRRARRAVQRRLARSRDLTAILEDWLQRGPGRTLQRQLARSLAGAALLLALVQGVGQAATITVTTNTPGVDHGDGKCSLIEAILNANAGAQPQADCAAGDPAPATNTIVLPTATHTLAANYAGTDNGLPLITSTIAIEGNGAKVTRKGSAPPFRLIGVDASGNLTLRNVTLSNGNGSYTSSSAGGAIENAGILTIQNSTITGNKAFVGGGIENVGTGTITVENSTISLNKAVSPFGIGGGMENFLGTAIIRNSIITGNQAGVTIGVGAGGGIENNRGTLTIENSTISGNKANGADYGYGGGLDNYSDSASTGTVTIIDSTISKNTAGGIGGGVSNDGSMTIQNSTISGNKAGKVYGYGGGIANSFGASLTIENSTITANKANGRGAYGGGIESGGDLTLSRSLISGNKAALGREADAFGPGTVAAGNFNLVGSKGNPGTLGFAPSGTDIVPNAATTGILGPLKNNGGPTQTHALKVGSPAVNAIPSSDPACTGTDQRGVVRPQPPGGNCDIGSFELE
jgi:hypothetical protein